MVIDVRTLIQGIKPVMANNMSRQVVPFCILCNKILTTSIDVGDLKHFQDWFDTHAGLQRLGHDFCVCWEWVMCSFKNFLNGMEILSAKNILTIAYPTHKFKLVKCLAIWAFFVCCSAQNFAIACSKLIDHDYLFQAIKIC